MRFDASDLNDGSVVEAGIDDFTVTTFECVGYMCGDIDSNLEGPNIADLVYLVAWMFSGGPAPVAMASADVNGSGGDINIEDLVYLVAYMFQEGPDLMCP